MTILVPSGGTVDYTLAIPVDPSLVGFRAYTQIIDVEFDALQQIATLTSSNGLALKLGLF